MNIFVIHASKNSPGHGNDAGGAFVPEAINFCKHHQANGHTCERVAFDNLEPDKRKRADAFLALVDKAQPFDWFVYLGHGLRNSLSSAAVDQLRRKDFTRILAKKAKTKRLIVTLYACSTGETTVKGADDGDGGFADRVRDDLEELGLTAGWVDGHTCAAHTTENPYVRRFDLGPGPNAGGPWLVAPDSAEWAKWRLRLNPPKGVTWRQEPFRFDFPYLEQDAVRAACR